MPFLFSFSFGFNLVEWKMAQTGSIGCVLSEEKDGLIVKKIIQGGSAHLSGRIAAGDMLLEIDGMIVRTLHSVSQHVSNRPVGSLFSLLIKRGGDEQKETVSVLSQTQRPLLEDNKDPCGISAALNVVREGVRVDQVKCLYPE